MRQEAIIAHHGHQHWAAQSRRDLRGLTACMGRSKPHQLEAEDQPTTVYYIE